MEGSEEEHLEASHTTITIKEEDSKIAIALLGLRITAPTKPIKDVLNTILLMLQGA